MRSVEGIRGSDRSGQRQVGRNRDGVALVRRLARCRWPLSTPGLDLAIPVVLLGALLVVTPAPLAGQSQSPLDRLARLTADSVAIEEALQRLQRSAGVSLVYSPDLLPADRRVGCACQRVTVREALARILDGTGLTFRSSATQIRVVPVGGSNGEQRGATGAVAGRVVAAGTDDPVVNATVELEGSHGVLSDEDGRFIIAGAAPGAHPIRVTSMGWAERVVDDVTVSAGDTARVTIRLDRAPVALPSILVAPGTFNLLEDVRPGVQRSLSRNEIETMPHVGEDIFRAMKHLPGVASSDISTKLNVRGGAESEVLVRLDGMELYEPYHMKDWDGAVGIIDVHALGGVELAAGGFGVEHGDRMAGVFDMRSRTSVDHARTTLGLSITNVTAMSRGGFDDGNGAWLASLRRGFMGIVIRLIGEDARLSPQYHDLFGKVSYQLSPAHRLTARVLHAGDDFGLHDVESNGLERVDLDTGYGSSYGWLTWDAKPHPNVSASTMLSMGRITRDRDGLVADFGRPDMPDSIQVSDDRDFTFAGIRHELGVDLSDRVLVKAGLDARRQHADYAYHGFTSTQYLDEDGNPAIRDDRVDVDLDNRGTRLGAWLAARVRPWGPLVAEAGLRYDRVTHTGDEDAAPRLLALLDLGPRTTVRGSWGQYWQSHGIQQLEVADGETGYSPAERSDQAAIGIEHRLENGVDVRLELYDRTIVDLRPQYINLEQDLRIFPEVEGDRMRIDPVGGRARGLEVSVKRGEGGRWAWAASYALAMAEDEVPGSDGQPCTPDEACSGRILLPRQYDQRHTIDFQAAYRPAPVWNLSLTWKYHSGWPATEWTYDAVTRPDGGVFWVRSFGPVRGIRLPAYHRLDLRVTRAFTVGGNPLQVFLDVLNLYDRTNMASWRYDFGVVDGEPIVTRHAGLTMLPRLPTFGVRYEF